MGNNHWTAPLVEERLVEAAGVLKRLPEEKVQGYFSAWPDVVLDANESSVGMIRCCAGRGRLRAPLTVWMRQCSGCSG